MAAVNCGLIQTDRVNQRETAFAILSQRALKGDLKARRNYFETSHGKSVCDGLGAIVKNSAHQAVVSGRKIIASAADLYKHCLESLSHETKSTKNEKEMSIRDFMYLERSSLQRVIEGTDVQTLKGTRKIHVTEGSGMKYGLLTRELSCYCPSCITGTAGCDNVPPWETRQLEPVAAENAVPTCIIFTKYIKSIYIQTISNFRSFLW